MDFCQVRDPADTIFAKADNNYYCSAHLDTDWIQSYFEENCKGSTSCAFRTDQVKEHMTGTI